MDQQVFHDPTGRRSRRALQFSALAVAIVALLVAGFFATLAFAPRLPHVALKDPRALRALHVETPRRASGKPAWTRVPAARPHSIGAGVRPLTVGFYVSWDANSRASLARRVNHIDVVSPQWVALKDSTGAISTVDDPQATALIAAAAHRPAVMPLVHNSADEAFDGPMADRLLSSPKARTTLAANLVALAQAKGYGGYMFDLENMSPRGVRLYPGFIAQMRAALRADGREVWVTAPFDGEGWPLAQLQRSASTLVLMAYDEHYGTGDPGPAAGQDWFERTLTTSLKGLDPDRTVLALGAYGYDWTVGQSVRRADAVTFHEATVLARDAGVDVASDPDSLNPTFAYQDERGLDHAVWFLDAVTAFNQIHAADSWRPRGYGLWRMGSEDPDVWSVLGRPYGAPPPQSLETVTAGPDVDFDGDGEVLRISATPSAGRRSLTVDPGSGLVEQEHYDVLPSGYVVERYGSRPGLVALTFDDGPDPRWTPRILDILKRKNAPATFFVIGKNMQERPDIVRREIADGHVVGSHTYTHPNIGQLPVAEVDVELNATQRLFETITGKSFRFFRPPFFGDAEPSTPREVEPLLLAQSLGYLTVGLRIDSDDWKKPAPATIIDRVLARLADRDPQTGGQIVLLHDSGGDRSRTVAALPGLIDGLRARGYRLVTVAQLAGVTDAQAMPPTERDRVELELDRIGFGFFRIIDQALTGLFLTAIGLGLARLVFLGVLAIVHRLRAPARTPAMIDPASGPLVSVLIPCFNEEAVIVQSLHGILASRWTRLEIIVLDDGSTDATCARVREEFTDEPRVGLLTFANGGKARALNRGLALAKGEIIVALDADTQFAPETIGMLARWFASPRVGAVAGNAIVGNRVNVVTRWQALEYVTAQNLERRALAALGAVTVVPGAVGAWRKSALEGLGGYPADTLAEDQDLTMAIQAAGWRVEFDPSARAYTEAPDTIAGLLKQRFRWSFGTLQCLWKHRAALFNPRRPVMGFVALPQIWLFQIILSTIAPLVDLAIVWSLASAVIDRAFHPVEWQPDNLVKALLYWAVFIFVDLSAGALGMALETRAPWADLPWLPVQRFGYRQLMYSVVLRSLVTAVQGPRVGWGKLVRRASVTAP